MNARRRNAYPRLAAATIVAAVMLAAATPISSSAQSLDQLNSQLGHQQARQQSLSGRLASLSGLISSLSSQISLVQGREAAVRAQLARDRAALTAAQASLARERKLLALLRTRLARARHILSRQLVSGYERDRPDIVSVVLEARGFKDLVERLDFLHRAEQQQKSIIQITRDAKAQADSAASRLAKLEAADRQITEATDVRARGLAGMDALLQSKQSAMQQARAAQQAALDASRARGAQLQSAIAQVQAQQAAAQQAAASPGPSGPSSGPSAPTGPALGPSGGWAIPYAIVLCESGGQNMPPNSAGASGYYQIIPSTWQMFGGTGPAAYLASKAEQDAVASRIYAGGSGVSNWDCAKIVGIIH
jgi:septal ring factor EnvC (AmiA/AmiB activator)